VVHCALRERVQKRCFRLLLELCVRTAAVAVVLPSRSGESSQTGRSSSHPYYPGSEKYYSVDASTAPSYRGAGPDHSIECDSTTDASSAALNLSVMKNTWSSGGVYSTPACQYNNPHHPSHRHTDTMGHPAYFVGHYPPRGGGHNLELRCNCNCQHLPTDRTILHGILTGRGYKFGYGATLLETPFFSATHGYHDHHHEPFYMGLEPIEAHSKGLSHGATSHSRYISPPAAK